MNNTVKCIHRDDALPLPKQETLSDVFDMLSNIVEETVQLVESTPNDQELGAKIRKHYTPLIIGKKIVENQIQQNG